MNESTSAVGATDSTYIFNTESAAETTRLVAQATVIQQATGLFPRLLTEADIAACKNVLDVGCGPGSWALDVAFHFPEICVVGLDVSQTLVAYAFARARSQQLTNVTFDLGNALVGLPYQDGAFGVVNVRFATAWLTAETWPTFLKECFRVLSPEGYLICTESEWPYTTSRALGTLNRLLFQAGLGLSVDGFTQGVVARLGNLLHEAGFDPVHRELHLLDFSFSQAEAHRSCYDNLLIVYQEMVPFLLKHGVAIEEEVAALHNAWIQEMWREEFCGISPLFTFIAHAQKGQS